VSSPVESFTTATTRTQEMASSALRNWADGLHSLSGKKSALPDVPGMVATYFDTMHQMLDNQRLFTEAMLRAVQSTQDAMSQVARAAELTADLARTTADTTASVTRAATKQTKAMARVVDASA
jgi:hypothetical protein